MNPKYPVYIISKGRYHNCLTVRELTAMNVPFTLVVEPCEYNQYTAVTAKENILVLPFENLGLGSTPARNFVFEHSIDLGHKRHWILDDNIEGFHRLNRNMKPKVTSGTIFKCAEDFTDRYTNVGLSGFNYYSFCKCTDKVPPYYLNTRIYSCILVNNLIPFRWRGRYNEDTDLSINVLKSGMCTILFNAFLAGKVTTMRMSGGNTDNVYTDNDDRYKFAKTLQELHPEIVTVTRKFNRYHHQVNYKVFKNNRLQLRQDVQITEGVNNYGMKLITL
jgi:hypothetical protein